MMALQNDMGDCAICLNEMKSEVNHQKIALFGCPVEKTLETIGNIEVNEGLPHPIIDGVWGKQAISASAAYLIYGFNEHNIELEAAYLSDLNGWTK